MLVNTIELRRREYQPGRFTIDVYTNSGTYLYRKGVGHKRARRIVAKLLGLRKTC